MGVGREGPVVLMSVSCAWSKESRRWEKLKWTHHMPARVFKIPSTLFPFVQSFLLSIRLIACVAGLFNYVDRIEKKPFQTARSGR